MMRSGDIAPTPGVTWVPAEPDRRQREQPRDRPPRKRRPRPRAEEGDRSTYQPDGRLNPGHPGAAHIDITV